MKKIILFMENCVAPLAGKFSKNIYMASLSEAIMSIIPMTMVGTLITIFSVIRGYASWIPDLSMISSFSFGLAGIVMAFTFPYFVMNRKKMQSKNILAGTASIGIFLMLTVPSFSAEGSIIFAANRLGAGGIFLGLVSGFVIVLVFSLCTRFSFFKNQSSIPEYLASCFDTIIPVFIAMLISWFCIGFLRLDFFALLEIILSPLTNFGLSYGGMLAYLLINAFLFFFGISPWTLLGIFYPIFLSGITQNAELVAAGGSPVYIATWEVMGTFISIGGSGATLMLCVLLLFSKSKKLNMIGKAAIVPSLMNINEPLVYGIPVVLNPILFIPFLLNIFLNTTITYAALSIGLVTIPSKVFFMWFVPAPVQAWINTQDLRAFLLLAVLLAVNLVVWYPFWKIYDKQQVKLENNSTEDSK